MNTDTSSNNVPEDHTALTVNDDTVIGAEVSADDTIITAPSDATIVGVPEVEDHTIAASVETDETVIPSSTTDQYPTLIGSLMDTSLGLAEILADVEEAQEAEEAERIQRTEELAQQSRFFLRHINGRKISLTQPVIAGRLPAAPRRGDGAVQLLVLESPEGIVSGTHARIEAQGDVVVVTDLNSTNGTRVIIPGKPTVLLAPGESMALASGAIIDLGDSNRLEVLG